ncbi:MAG: hypothetical protein ACYCZ0_03360 [Minisyncoccota bacterium]
MRIHETVVVRGEALRIVDGEVETESGTAASPSAQRRALRIAYARALARRDPILGIPGNDPQFLAESVNQLSEVVDALVKKQGSAQDALSVRSMYPIRFLQSLAALEGSRIAFIESGSDADELTYRAALSRALATGRLDIVNFEKAFALETSGKELRFQGFGGTISIRNMRNALQSIETQFEELENQTRRFSRCMGGSVEFCDPNALVIGRTFSEPLVETPRISVASLSLVNEVRGLYAETMTKRAAPMFTDASPIVLTQSVCLSDLPSPYVVMLGNTSRWGIPPIWYVTDIFFSKTEGSQAPVLEYLAKERDIRYSRINPMMYYMCPDMGLDLAKAWAVRATAEFAQKHPKTASVYRERLLSAGGVWYESDAYAYMRAALKEIHAQDAAPHVRKEFEMTALLWNKSGAGLDGVLKNIVRIESNRLDTQERGVPFDMSAGTQFLTRAAFPTLFLARNLSKDSTVLPQTKKNASAESFLSSLATYGDMRTRVPRDRIVHDLREFLIFEGARF